MRVSIPAFVLLLFAACADDLEIRVVEEHHEAWAAWEEARVEGRIAEGALLIHLDAHADLGIPDGVDSFPDSPGPEDASRLARECLSVSDFIVPAVRGGTVGEVVWVTPPWLPHRFREVPAVSGVAARATGLDSLPREESAVILDVDLDFFACENPHAFHRDVEIGEAEYRLLLRGGRIRITGEAREGDEVTRSIVLSRPPGRFSWPVRLDRIHDERMGRERYVKGCICMGEYLDAFPVHRPAEEDLLGLLDRTEAALREAGLKPGVVTVSRSADSGFVPATRVDRIEAALLSRLARVYPGAMVRR